ncbi:LysR family transcriptional regulator [Roseomonas sp. GC11]|uniref:LysR family transcriptional regulator n=1 Tax=Roseomonas sp. GC11 TaxID=2950546 RepID=UPI00210BBBA3|nr:LysR family transcriptional regulator [Roseomonas sp. GC11]MCQ4158667.1 LysR family transcriptional regulator [Roseomonas sp. GC11]
MAHDIRTLDLNLLKTLDALLEERSVTRAAARLGLTQPAVSGMLTRLRDAFGDPLFIRAQRGIVPTPRAQELAAPLRQALSGIEAMLQPAAFDPARADFTLGIAATDYALRAILVPFMAALRARAPGIRVAVLPVQAARLPEQLERGEIHLALVTPESLPPGLRARRLFEERYVCALRAGHPAAAAPLDLDRFCALDHAMVSLTGGGFLGVTDEALARLGRQRRVSLSVMSFLALVEILRESDLIAVVPERLVAGAAGLALRPPPLDIPGFTKLAVWHERTQRDPGHRWVRALLAGL